MHGVEAEPTPADGATQEEGQLPREYGVIYDQAGNRVVPEPVPDINEEMIILGEN